MYGNRYEEILFTDKIFVSVRTFYILKNYKITLFVISCDQQSWCNE